ncbi:MAG TPA: TonB family protein [Candidatus Didemnitutus sp.]|nr:TonB family protein [Candidatus Didemnitutus sp.]
MKITTAVIALGLAAGCSSTPQSALVEQPVRNEAVFEGDYTDVKKVSQPPILVKPVNPVYPYALRNSNVQGLAEIAYIVDTKGVPRQVQVVSANHPAFAQAAQEAIAQWRFKPAMNDGKPVAVLVRQYVTFNTQ